MDERWPIENEPGDDESAPTAGLSYRGENIWLESIHLSPYECPDCLKHDAFDCDICEFFEPETCQLLSNLLLRKDIRTLFNIYRERRVVQFKRQRALIDAVRSELQAHGRPLHYTVLARMVAERHRKLRVNEFSILRIMTFHPEEFECVEVGVYRCRGT